MSVLSSSLMLRRSSVLALVVCASLSATSARAQPAGDATTRERDTAKALGREGLQLYRDGDYEAAVDRLAVAYRLAPVPTVGLWLARGLIRLGRLVEADARLGEVAGMNLADVAERLSALQSERLSPEGLAVHEKAVDRAAGERRALAARIPKIVLVAPDGARIVIDGAPRPEAGRGAVPLDPGEHRIVVTLGEQTQARTVELVEGETTRITIELTSDSEGAQSGASEPAAPEPGLTEPPIAFTSTQAILGWTGLGLGGAALVAGGIMSLVASSRYNSLDCPDDQCGPSQHDAADAYNALRVPSGVLLIAGGVVAAAGLTVALTAPDEETQVALQLRPGAITLGGSF